jgi:hypothetical protein
MTTIIVDLNNFNGDLRGLNEDAKMFVLDVFFHFQGIKHSDLPFLLRTLRDVYNISVVRDGAVLA